MGISDYSRSTNYIRTKESSKNFKNDILEIFIYLFSTINPTRNCSVINKSTMSN